MILILLALAVYAWLANGQGEVTSIAFNQDDRLFAAAGQYGGVVVLDASFSEKYAETLTPTATQTPTPDGTATPQESPPPETTAQVETPAPTPVVTYDITRKLSQWKRFDTPGNAVAVVPYQLGETGRSLILVADAGYGLQVYDEHVDEDDPQMLLTIPLRDVRDVAVRDGRVYVAAGEHGVLVVNLFEVLPTFEPAPPAATPEATAVPPIDYSVQGLPRRGEANGLAFSITTYSSATVDKGKFPGSEYELEMESALRFSYLFVADGPAGITVFDLNELLIGTPTPMPFNEIQGEVQSISIPYDTGTNNSWPYAYVAAGTQGLVVCNISKPDQITILGTFALDGARALDVAVVGRYAYVAAGRQGLYILDIHDPENIELVGQFTNVKDQIYAVEVYKTHVFLAGGQEGVIVLQVSDPHNPVVTEDGYVLDWGENSLGYALRDVLETHKITKRTGELLLRGLLDGGLALMGLFVCLMVFAGFVLPADSPLQRFRVLGRMLQSFFGGHPAGWFIDDGEVHPRVQDRQHGLGVAVLDAGSAAVFTNHEQRWQVSGPGMCFVTDDDHLLGAVSLLRQAIVIGPRLGEDPLHWRGPQESRADYRARQYRRRASSAQTSDGIEVVATLRVIFSLDGQAVENGTQYGYDAGHVSRSVASENLPASEQRRPGRVPWLAQETLSVIVRRLWRDNLARYLLAELFAEVGDGPETGLERALRDMYAHLTQAEIRELDEHGAETGRQFPSREFRTLHGRGIHVHGIYLESISCAAPEQQQVTNRWRDDWPERTTQEKRRLDALDEQDTLLAYSQALIADLAGRVRDLLNPPSLQESLQILLENSRDAAPGGSDEARLVDQILDDLEGGPE